MALNITFDGVAHIGDGSLSNLNVAYQAYFHKVNGGSSPHTWNNKRIVEDTGYWNVNLGSGDWLTQGGAASAGDVVVVVFWSPVTADRLDACVQLSEWSCFRITLDGSSTYTNDIQVRSNICPNLNWLLPDTALVGQNITANNTSTDIHQWNFSGNTMYHINNWYTSLMSINVVDNSDYDWGDGHQDNDLPGTTNGTHSWVASGDYDVELVIEDSCGCTVTGTDQIRILNNAPVPNIMMTPGDPDPNEVVTFQYTGTDVDNIITNIHWTINDSGVYGNTDTIDITNARDDIIPHIAGLGTDWFGQAQNPGAFTNPGSHQVSIIISWWDGFITRTMDYSETYTQGIFSGPAINFGQVPGEAEKESPVRFINTSTSTSRVGLGLPDHIEYNWRWTDGAVIENELDKPYGYELIKTPSTVACKVQLCAEWSDGWDTHETCIEKDVVFKTTVIVSEEDCYYNLNIIGTSDDGSVTGYGWTISSGISQTGSWTETWSSPTGLEQNDKKICFTAEGWYKIEGTVYGTGNPTSDDEIMEVTEVCPTTPGDGIVAICPPDVSGREIRSGKKIRVRELKPGLRGRMKMQPSARVIHGQKIEGISPFPGPKNI